MPDSRSDAIEYFLTKLKRTDDEMMTKNAELREINEEISRKVLKIERLETRLNNLMREEEKREIERLELMKTELKGNVKKADRVLAELGLIWVGENSSRNTELGVRFIASPEGSLYRPDLGHQEVTNEQNTVTPFTGKGYRLGTGSEIFTRSPEAANADRTSEQKTSHKRHSEIEDVTAESSWRNSPSLSQTSSDSRIRPAEKTGTKCPEELPLEFRLMSKSERRRALKQVSVQIQKNMNKYPI